MRADPNQRIPVWDRLVRAFHWGLVAAVTIALATGFLETASLLDLHVAAGALIGVLLALRVVWGFTGTTYARFASFVVSPPTLSRHVAAMLRGTAKPHVGHNPLGGWMILSLMTTLTVLLVTGVAVLGGVLKDGPLAPFASFATGRELKELHELAAFALLALIGLHVTGIVVESLRTRESLIVAMLRGWKHQRADAEPAAPRQAKPALAGILSLLVLLPAGVATAHFSRLPVAGLPSQPLDTVYAKECGACHSPHHPSIATAATWASVMRGLDRHFGDNASLDEPVATRLAAYLADNGAEHWDTQASNRLARSAATDPLRITATDGWQRLHRHVDRTVFDRKSIGGRVNCSRCHSDAEAGRFDPRAIHIPEEKQTP